MPHARARSLNDTPARRDRRLVTGLVVSAVLHGLLLSLQFGVPGLDAGSGGPIHVRLAPALPASVPEPLPSPVAVPDLPSPLPAAPAGGMRLVDPRPAPVVVAQAPPSPKPAAGP
ncbi:MAG: hypothetical protein ACREWI_16920, partial [Telluria sp.]